MNIKNQQQNDFALTLTISNGNQKLSINVKFVFDDVRKIKKLKIKSKVSILNTLDEFISPRHETGSLRKYEMNSIQVKI